MSAYKTEIYTTAFVLVGIVAFAPFYFKKEKKYHLDRKKPLNAITANRTMSQDMKSFKNAMYLRQHILSNLPIEKFELPSWKKPACILVACGSFSPPTYFHMRMMEEAKMHLSEKYQVIGGILSVVNDEYGVLHKPSLKDANCYHRIQMCRLATNSSKWIGISDWEIKQSHWTKIAIVLKQYSEALNSNDYMQYLTDQKLKTEMVAKEDGDDIFLAVNERKIHIKLLCGSDLLLSFSKPNLFTEEHKRMILSEFGVACIQRKGQEITTDILENCAMFADDLENIHVIEPSVENTISSSIIRELMQEDYEDYGRIQYLLADSIIEHIQENHLYMNAKQ